MPSAARVTLFTLGGAVLTFGVGSVAITGLILLSSHDVRAQEAFELTGDRLTITSDGGGVHLRPGTTGVVNVERRVTESIWGADPEWDMDKTDGVLRLDTNCPPMYQVNCDGSYNVTVPPEVRFVTVRNDDGSISVNDMHAQKLELESDNGSVKIRNSAAGEFKLSSDNGSISVNGTWARWVDAGSDNGSIKMTLKNEPDYVKASSDNGSLRVTVPAGPGQYKVTADSDNGSANVDDGLRNDASPRQLLLSSDNGSVKVSRTPETPQGWPMPEPAPVPAPTKP